MEKNNQCRSPLLCERRNNIWSLQMTWTLSVLCHGGSWLILRTYNRGKLISSLTELTPCKYQFLTNKLKKPTDPSRQPVVLISCGSFNPVTFMHLRMFEICKDWCNDNGMEVLGGYLSPVGDAYKKATLIPMKYRCEMLSLALESSEWLNIDTWEARRPEFTPTRQVMDYIHRAVNEHLQLGDNVTVQLKLVAGADLLGTFNVPKLWADQDMDKITSDEYGFLCLERTGSDIEDIISKNIILTKNKLNVKTIKVSITNDVSSTKMRELVKNNKSLKYLTLDPVIEYISSNNLYK
ncbi:nicotinamide-nucleotide adenylyltransferase [Heterostelium album PN500]|uniref:Nicotinamide-nucleotide adenylyltransferase n=1 Tax=Heterostelium pallidum (strain ATCC 26659 / Pp 5 / PN500) TaxID=670386 RepID=D3B7N6_HETP5|nr:nicotinamide-nucleotide adenylyltransferase [Heterostelium album PN500]EFA82779.1 nicotinamide-nucleotide adenylyltransferase [Heterostelium album PN500]|eukprot:XP_020434896.1 nicotinamide-nucleotide adenylyltransferase [Heterostelium album PN500]